MNVASDKAKALLHKYLVASHYSSHIKLMVDGDGFGEIREAVADCRAAQKELMDYIGELEAKTKWSAGHPEHSGEVLVYVRTKRLGHKDFDLFYSMDYWDNTIGKWAWYDADGEVLGWCERDNFDLPIESSETTGHLEEEEE